MFLGYKSGVKGYKLWCLETSKIIVSRDVIFDETAMLHDLASKNSFDKIQQELSAQVEFEISGSIPEFTSQSSSEMHGDAASLPPLEPPKYSIAKDGSRRNIRPP